MKTLQIASVRKTRFILVDCGAREFSPDHQILVGFPRTTLIGFEPDIQECDRLARIWKGRVTLFPIALADQPGTRSFHVTRDPVCSSIFQPNSQLFGKFLECAEASEVLQTIQIQVESLDSYLPPHGITQVDFLKLDAQGAELEILRGSESFLRSSVLGFEIEVEFSPIYQGQPLFAEVDSYARHFQFMLFDLSRNRYRRQVLPPRADTRGQLLWGDALYLRDYQYFVDRGMKSEALKLAVLASVHGFHDYALEILESLLHGRKVILTDAERADIAHAREVYLLSLSRRKLLERLVLPIFRSRLRKLFVTLIRLFRRGEHDNASWED